jgi:hypothetical protein
VLEELPFPDGQFTYTHQRLLVAAIPAHAWPRLPVWKASHRKGAIGRALPCARPPSLAAVPVTSGRDLSLLNRTSFSSSPSCSAHSLWQDDGQGRPWRAEACGRQGAAGERNESRPYRPGAPAAAWLPLILARGHLLRSASPRSSGRDGSHPCPQVPQALLCSQRQAARPRANPTAFRQPQSAPGSLVRAWLTISSSCC